MKKHHYVEASRSKTGIEYGKEDTVSYSNLSLQYTHSCSINIVSLHFVYEECWNTEERDCSSDSDEEFTAEIIDLFWIVRWHFWAIS